MSSGRVRFTPRFTAVFKREVVEVDYKVGRLKNGVLEVAVKKPSWKAHRLIDVAKLSDVPQGCLAITRQFYLGQFPK